MLRLELPDAVGAPIALKLQSDLEKELDGSKFGN